MIAWARDALQALERCPRVALVTVLATEGSAPREAGTRMVVTEYALIGTIGGGALEHQAARQARALLDQPAGEWRVQDYPLGPFLGQCCGGRVRVMLEHLDPAEARWLAELAEAHGPVALSTRFEAGRLDHALEAAGAEPTARGPAPEPGDVLAETLAADAMPVLIFGAGHVGCALHRALKPLPFAVSVVDVRPELADGAEIVTADAAEHRIRQAPANAAVLVMTHDHALDYRLIGAALRGEARFIGLIGSATKRARFRGRLGRDGVSEADLKRIVCPIGLRGITGKEPAVIAASVAAQLLGLRGQTS
jgi:xanthine dehydrogenase accessory factor